MRLKNSMTLHWQITLNDFEDDYADGQDTFTAKYETFPKTESPDGNTYYQYKEQYAGDV